MTPPFIRTVLGDIAPEDLGVCYAHEHLIIEAGFGTVAEPDFRIDSVEAAVAELSLLHAAGGRAAIDSMPCDAGRSAVKLAETSRRSGVHIVCPTGLHLAKYYPPNHWGERLSADELADLFVRELDGGIDANDCGGPDFRPTAHRAGVVKVAGSRDRLTERERRVFAAAARAQRRTGCPILTHTEEGTAGREQIEILRAEGADLTHVVLSHTDRLPDPEYHRSLLRTGVNLEYDSAFRWKNRPDNPTLDLLVTLLPEFPDQLMIGMDAARRTYWRSYGGAPGLDFLLTEFVPRLRAAGVSEDSVERMLVRTPARAYAFGKTQSTDR